MNSQCLHGIMDHTGHMSPCWEPTCTWSDSAPTKPICGKNFRKMPCNDTNACTANDMCQNNPNDNTKWCFGTPTNCENAWTPTTMAAFGLYTGCMSMQCNGLNGQCEPEITMMQGQNCNQDPSMVPNSQSCHEGQCQGGQNRCNIAQGWSWNPAYNNGQGICQRKKISPTPPFSNPQGPNAPGAPSGGP